VSPPDSLASLTTSSSTERGGCILYSARGQGCRSQEGGFDVGGQKQGQSDIHALLKVDLQPAEATEGGVDCRIGGPYARPAMARPIAWPV
jgi:hypothetical protein